MAARKTRHATPRTTPRHLWLAALGAVVVARREAGIAAGIARDEACRVGGQAAQLASDTRDVARGLAITVQEQAGPRLAQAGSAITARLAPVVERLLTPAPAARRPRKAPARRAAAGRTQAASRIVRKGRG